MTIPAVTTASHWPSGGCGDALTLGHPWEDREYLLHSQSQRRGIKNRVILINLVLIIYR